MESGNCYRVVSPYISQVNGCHEILRYCKTHNSPPSLSTHTHTHIHTLFLFRYFYVPHISYRILNMFQLPLDLYGITVLYSARPYRFVCLFTIRAECADLPIVSRVIIAETRDTTILYHYKTSRARLIVISTIVSNYSHP